MSRLAAYKDDLDLMKANYATRVGEKQAIENNIQGLQTQVDGHKQKQLLNQQLSALLQKAAELARNNAKSYLEEVGTLALQIVFDKDMKFVIEMAEKAGRAEAEFYVEYTDGTEVVKVKPDDSCGGGVIDTLSIASRFAYLEQLTDPVIQSCIVFDEPGKMVSEVAANRMANMMSELKKTFQRQTIMVTHNDAYGSVADKEYTVMMTGVESKVVEGHVDLTIQAQGLVGEGSPVEVLFDGPAQ